MKKIHAVGFAAAVAAVVATASIASAVASMEGCNLPNGKWTCIERVEQGDVVTTYERNGSSHMCKVFESSSTVTYYEAYNPAGKRNADHDGEPVVTGSGDPVHIGNETCPPGTP